MIYGHMLDVGQADDLAAWIAVHLPMDLRHRLMAERPLLYEALFPGCTHDVILGRAAAALRRQAHDRMVKTSQPAAAHLLRLIEGTAHPWEGSDTVDATQQFLALFGITAPEPAGEAAGADDIADAKRLLMDRVLAAVPAGQRAAAEDHLTGLLYLTEGSLDAAGQAELIRTTLAERAEPSAQAERDCNPQVIDARSIPSGDDPRQATELHPPAPPCGATWLYEGLNAGGHQVFACPGGDHKLITSRTAYGHAKCGPPCEDPTGVISTSDYGPVESGTAAAETS